MANWKHKALGGWVALRSATAEAGSVGGSHQTIPACLADPSPSLSSSQGYFGHSDFLIFPYSDRFILNLCLCMYCFLFFIFLAGFLLTVFLCN